MWIMEKWIEKKKKSDACLNAAYGSDDNHLYDHERKQEVIFSFLILLLEGIHAEWKWMIPKVA